MTSSSRLVWSWVTGGKRTQNSTWDGTQTVPRVITMAPPPAPGDDRGQELAVNPAPAVCLHIHFFTPFLYSFYQIIAISLSRFDRYIDNMKRHSR